MILNCNAVHKDLGLESKVTASGPSSSLDHCVLICKIGMKIPLLNECRKSVMKKCMWNGFTNWNVPYKRGLVQPWVTNWQTVPQRSGIPCLRSCREFLKSWAHCPMLRLNPAFLHDMVMMPTSVHLIWLWTKQVRWGGQGRTLNKVMTTMWMQTQGKWYGLSVGTLRETRRE